LFIEDYNGNDIALVWDVRPLVPARVHVFRSKPGGASCLFLKLAVPFLTEPAPKITQRFIDEDEVLEVERLKKLGLYRKN
jgi:hypothetical protein